MRVYYDSPWFSGLLPCYFVAVLGTWRHKLTQEPRESGGKEASWKPFGARVLQPRRTVTDGKARYKNWVRVFVP